MRAGFAVNLEKGAARLACSLLRREEEAAVRLLPQKAAASLRASRKMQVFI